MKKKTIFGCIAFIILASCTPKEPPKDPNAPVYRNGYRIYKEKVTVTMTEDPRIPKVEPIPPGW